MALCSHYRPGNLFNAKGLLLMRKKLHKFILAFSLLFALQISPVDIQAQCPMCRMSAESNLKSGGTAGKGLNAGILFMLAAPYTLVASMAFLYVKNKKRVEEAQLNDLA